MNDSRGPRSGGSKRNYQAPKKTVEILPNPEILESYNYVIEGSAKMILDMFVAEQKHRHAWEERALKVHAVSSVLGQILGFMIAVSIFVAACVIGVYGNATLAATIWIFGMSIIVMAGLVWTYAKTLGQRPLFSRPTMRTHFRPQKEGPEMPDE